MTTFEYGDIVQCVTGDDTMTGPLKTDALYVIEAVAKHGKSVKVAGDWHAIRRFVKVGESTIDFDSDARVQAKAMNFSLDRAQDASRALSSAFIWAKSEEGEDYWRNVHKRIGDYIERFEDL